MDKPEIPFATGIPSYSTSVPAGFPSPAMDYLEDRTDLNKEFISNPLSTFLISSEGNSMINAFIPPRARLIVDRSISPKNGDIVLAIINGEWTVKYLRKNDFKCWLCPANSKLKDIEVTEEMNLQVWGVVTTILINTNDVKQCSLL